MIEELNQFVMGSFVVIGLVNGIQLAFNKQWVSFGKFAVAVVAGGVFGALQWFGLPSIQIGIAVGISSSGVYKVVQKLSGE